MRTTGVQLQRNGSMGRSRRRGRLRMLRGTRVQRTRGKARGDLSRPIGGRVSRVGVQGFPKHLGGLNMLDFTVQTSNPRRFASEYSIPVLLKNVPIELDMSRDFAGVAVSQNRGHSYPINLP